MASLVKGRTPEPRRILDLLFVWLERSDQSNPSAATASFRISSTSASAAPNTFAGSIERALRPLDCDNGMSPSSRHQKILRLPGSSPVLGFAGSLRRRSQLWLDDDPRVASANRSLPDSST